MTWVDANILVTGIAYFASTALFMGYVLTMREPWTRAARRAFSLASVLHLVALIHVFASSAPVSAAAYVAMFSAFGVSAVYQAGSLAGRFRLAGAFVAPLVTVALLGTWVGTQQTRPVETQVHAFVTPVHIAASIGGVLAFLVAFVASVFFVVQDMQLRQKRLDVGWSRGMPAQAKLERVAARAIEVGFPLYTLGIVFGGVWALREGLHRVSEQYVLALVSWLVYGLVIHGRLRIGWRGRKAAAYTMLGFVGSLGVVLIYAVRSAA